jgi:hypothetical protein
VVIGNEIGKIVVIWEPGKTELRKARKRDAKPC